MPVLFADYVKLMFDLQVVAFQADLTRVSTMMMGREGDVRTYPEIGMPDPHHPLTHHGGKPDWIERVTQINTHHMELFTYLIQRLKATRDGDGALLDRSMVMYGSGIATETATATTTCRCCSSVAAAARAPLPPDAT